MIYLDIEKEEPLYKQLYEGIKTEIIAGSLKYNSVLMPIRKMAEELRISRNTVDHAYQQLVSEGYLRSVRGGGYFVDYLSDGFAAGASETINKERRKKMPEKLKYDFKYECIESSAFPWTKWRKYVQNALLEEECLPEISYESNKGNYDLRENLCTYLSSMRGVKCSPAQIVICPGTQFAIHTILSVLPKREYRLAFEEPGYDGMKKVFVSGGMTVESIKVEDDGLDMRRVREKKCNLLYITPSHQFPTGVMTSLSKRIDILNWAEENDAYIIENDYDNEFSHTERKLPSLQSMDKSGRVIYVSMLTKVLSPSIRCAYFVLPKRLLKCYEEKFSFFNSSLPTYHQRALARFIDDGMLEKHVRAMARINKRKYDIIKQIFNRYSDGLVRIFKQPAGSHTLINIPLCQNEEDIIAYMRQNSIGLYGTKMYWQDKSKAAENVFLFGFNALNEENLRAGCLEFIRVLKEYFAWKPTVH
ncbi:MAG: PLP-dependent aminotransferase family protein [bacterium]